MSTNWAALARTYLAHYLAHRDPAVLEQAIAVAQEQEVVALLKEFQKPSQVWNGEHIVAVERCAGVLHESLHRAGRTEEALTVALLDVDLRLRLVEIYKWLPVEQQLRALQMGLSSCDIAIALATELNDFSCVALYWVVAGDCLRAARRLDTARTAFEEALDIYHSLYHQQPQVYERYVATTLGNLGGVLRELREWTAARQAHEQALAIHQRLAAQQPQVYEPDVAITLSNLGTVLDELQEWAQARQAYQEAIVICERHRLWFESASIYHAWGQMEEDEGNTTRALELFEECVQCCEQGLHQLVEREHRDLFKSQIELAYDRLIEHYARLATANGAATLRHLPGPRRAKATAKDAARERLVGLLEALRHIETLAGFGETDSAILTFRANNREKNQMELSSWEEQTEHSQARANRRYPGHHRAGKDEARGHIDRHPLPAQRPLDGIESRRSGGRLVDLHHLRG